jgi:hypothetical protein
MGAKASECVSEDQDESVSVSLLQQNIELLSNTHADAIEPSGEETMSSTLSAWPHMSASPHPRWPSDFIQCPRKQVVKTEHMTVADYDEVVASVFRLYDQLPSECGKGCPPPLTRKECLADPAYCPQADWAGCVLRLAAHDFMDFKGGVGGSDGCVDFSDPDNYGLRECFTGGLSGVALIDSYIDFCDRISLADFFVVAAEAMMNKTRSNALLTPNESDEKRATVDFRSQFKYGRITSEECVYSYGRLPDAEKGCEDVDNILIHNLGLTWINLLRFWEHTQSAKLRSIDLATQDFGSVQRAAVNLTTNITYP